MGFRTISFEVDGDSFEGHIKLCSFGKDPNWASRKRIILIWLISAVFRKPKFSLPIFLFSFIEFSFSLSIQER